MTVHHQNAPVPTVTLPLHFSQPPPQIPAQNLISTYQQQRGGQGSFEQHQRDAVSVGSYVWDESSSFVRNGSLKQTSQHSFDSNLRVSESYGVETTESVVTRFFSFVIFLKIIFRFQPPQPTYQYGQQNIVGTRTSDYPPSLISLDISDTFKKSTTDCEQDISTGFRHFTGGNRLLGPSHANINNETNSFRGGEIQRNGIF